MSVSLRSAYFRLGGVERDALLVEYLLMQLARESATPLPRVTAAMAAIRSTLVQVRGLADDLRPHAIEVTR